MWTRFMDMSSGGGTKEEPYDNIYIEAPEDEAIIIFYNRFGHNPNKVTCTCCGEDYSISEEKTFEQASGYARNCAYAGKKYIEREASDYGKYQTVASYKRNKDVLVIPKSKIKKAERVGDAPTEGYVWQ